MESEAIERSCSLTKIPGVKNLSDLEGRLGGDVKELNKGISDPPRRRSGASNLHRVIIVLEDERPPSANVMHAGIHWTKRRKIANEKHALVARNIPDNLLPYECKVTLTFRVHMNGKVMDCSNLFWAAKMYEDGLVNAGILKDDSPKYVQSLTLESVPDDRDYVEIVIEKVVEDGRKT